MTPREATPFSNGFRHGRVQSHWRQPEWHHIKFLTYPLLGAGLFALAACTEKPATTISQGQAVGGLLGGIVTDEPQAALIGRAILADGGSAADAVAAAYFTLAVTYPSAASLGGGGICLVYDTGTDETETLEFLPGAPATDGPFAVPGAIRGIAALHARYGRKNWGEIVAPAEEKARFGHSLSRAAANGLQDIANIYEQTGGSLRLFPFLSVSGNARAEGHEIVQLSLAGSLSAIRSKGVSAFYGGNVGRTFVTDLEAIGGTLTIDDLRAYKPFWRATRMQDLGNLTLHTALPPPDSGNVMFVLLERLKEWKGGFNAADMVTISQEILRPAADAARIAEPGLAYADTSIVAGEKNGSAAACSFTMVTPFGSGQYSAGTGLLPAPPTARHDRALAPMLVVNHNVREAYMATAASGDAGAAVASAGMAIALINDGKTVDGAMADRRAYSRANLGIVAEEGADIGDKAAGDAIIREQIGRVAIFWCDSGLRSDPSACLYRTDSRGFGLAVGAN